MDQDIFAHHVNIQYERMMFDAVFNEMFNEWDYRHPAPDVVVRSDVSWRPYNRVASLRNRLFHRGPNGAPHVQQFRRDNR